jgi:H+/Cl- antiporter ClcA
VKVIHGLIWLLPLAGLVVGGLYHYWGASVAKGNNQLIEELQKSTQTIPLLMMPMILVTTVITHLFGGSAGREGTAVQMGGALADNLYLWGSKLTGKLGFKRDTTHFDRKIILIVGISAGFASVFGTPLAGTVFALEVAIIGKMRYEAILPSLLGAIIADYVCQSVWHVGTHIM